MKSRRNEEIGILGAGCWNAIILEIRFGTLCMKEISEIRGSGIGSAYAESSFLVYPAYGMTRSADRPRPCFR